jgi:hypothetical protein
VLERSRLQRDERPHRDQEQQRQAQVDGAAPVSRGGRFQAEELLQVDGDWDFFRQCVFTHQARFFARASVSPRAQIMGPLNQISGESTIVFP